MAGANSPPTLSASRTGWTGKPDPRQAMAGHGRQGLEGSSSPGSCVTLLLLQVELREVVPQPTYPTTATAGRSHGPSLHLF